MRRVFFEGPARAFRVSAAKKMIAVVIPQQRRRGRQAQGFLIGRLGLVEFLLRVQRRAQQAARAGIVGVRLEEGAQAGLGLVEPALFERGCRARQGGSAFGGRARQGRGKPETKKRGRPPGMTTAHRPRMRAKPMGLMCGIRSVSHFL